MTLGRRRFLRAAAVLLAGFVACRPVSPAPSPRPRPTLGYFPNVTHAPALLLAARSPDLPFDVKTFNAGPALIEALFAGAVDVGYVGPSPAVNGYVQSKGQALRIVAGAMSGGASFVVRPNAGVKGPADLAGKKLATPQRGNTQDVALRTYLRLNGLKPREQGGEVDVVPTANPDIVNLFKQGQIDGAWVPEPWASTLVLQADGQVFVDERTLWPGGRFATTNVVASIRLLAERPDAVKALLKAHVEALDYLAASPADARKTVGEQIARITTQPVPADLLERAFANQDATYDPLVPSVLAQADNAFALGFLGDTKPDLSRLFDLTLLNDLLGAAGKPGVAAG